MKRIPSIKIKTVLPSVFLAVLSILAGCEDRQTEASADSEALQNSQAVDMGKQPWALDIEEATVNNPNYRAAKWTGEHLQMVLMSLKPDEEIDLELHKDVDQFIRIEQGEARIRMGKSKDDLSFDKTVSDDWAILIPAGHYHHNRNTGNSELKLYSIYAPVEHKAGTIHKTYQEARDSHQKQERENKR